MDDRDITELFEARDEAALNEVEAKFGKYLTCIAENILSCREDSEEAVNDTYLAAWNSIPPAKPQNLGAYLGKITRNFALKKLKFRNADKRGSGKTDAVLDEIGEFIPSGEYVGRIEEEMLITEVINRFLCGMSREKRMIFTRRFWYFSSVKEIAEDLGVSESKVKMVLSRQKKALKKLLEDEGVYL